ncbi:MAG: PH domain-containing protein, partial [Candidatus Micrarchaeota archaeon]|nr:PH domain-containing protein [Candidatus Micrarchaeota archaeon]
MAKKCELDKDFKGTQCGIDSRIILVWFLPIILFIVGFWAFLAFTYYSDPKLSILGLGSAVEIYAILALLLLLFGIPSFIWFFLAYRAIKFTISDDQLVIQEGVINKKRTVIPYEKIQDINLHRPLLYRLAGLALIEIETAGVSGHSPEGSIPGVANADQIVKEILAHVQVFQTPHSSKQEQESDVHEAILSEIRELRKEMEARSYDIASEEKGKSKKE